MAKSVKMAEQSQVGEERQVQSPDSRKLTDVGSMQRILAPVCVPNGRMSSPN